MKRQAIIILSLTVLSIQVMAQYSSGFRVYGQGSQTLDDQMKATIGNPVATNAASIPPRKLAEIFQQQIKQMYGKTESDRIIQHRQIGFDAARGFYLKESDTVGEKHRVRVIQHISGSRYLACLAAGYTPSYRDSDTFAIDLEYSKYADGEVLSLPLVRTGNIFEYTTVLGAKKRVEVCEIKKPQTLTDLTEQDFAESLKNGHAFMFIGDYIYPCLSCSGKGYTDNPNTGSIQRKLSCSQCKGKGKIPQKAVFITK